MSRSTPIAHPAVWLYDYEPTNGDLLSEVIHGLRQAPKILPSKFFYDDRGSQLFDQICELDEYYPTRTELSILRAHAHDMAQCIGPRALLVELGSGSSIKTQLLLDHLPHIAAYVPIDISREHLKRSAQRLLTRYPKLTVLPVCADYLRDYDIPCPPRPPAKIVFYFPGSTIGNLHPPQVRNLLRRLARLIGRGGGLLIGVDLCHDPDLLLPAYDDARGVTAQFNLNLLHRINREAGANFDLRRFQHLALWNQQRSRMEMHLISRTDQTVTIADEPFHLNSGETIRTECSYKFTLPGFASLARDYTLEQAWTDPCERFGVQYLTVR
jgi:dimethylhistidine N-methyltransferase